ncbi:DUF2000 domain-containing protein [Frankia sp. CiP3]|uniref:DUF2000 domain-containing protein n=1 Tax=Frankia sp. CiP3 TaxID=2880971 RepID=UPI001EF6256A|nr:DUF2000 domain-containing protein [Frankia sp. CiP3]
MPDKVAIIIDGSLQIGLAMNTVAALSLSVGRMVDGILGDDSKDANGLTHKAITRIPVPILKSDAEGLKEIFLRASASDGVFVVDFTTTAQTSRTYDEYEERLAQTATADLPYIGVALSGPKKDVNKLVGSLPLYR